MTYKYVNKRLLSSSMQLYIKRILMMENRKLSLYIQRGVTCNTHLNPTYKCIYTINACIIYSLPSSECGALNASASKIETLKFKLAAEYTKPVA